MIVYATFILEGQHYHPFGLALETHELAVAGVVDHFRTAPPKDEWGEFWRSSPDLVFRVFRSDDEDGHSSIVQVCPDKDRPMMVLANYSIIRSEMKDQPFAERQFAPESPS